MSAKCIILELPPEIILSIVEHVDDTGALRSLAQTCSKFRVPAEARLYASITLLSPLQTHQLCRSLESRKDRADAIRSIQSVCEHEHRGGAYEPPFDITRKARKLRALTLESPWCNGAFIDPTNFAAQEVLSELLRGIGESRTPHDHFSHLAALTVHWTGTDVRFWTITPDLAGIFTHPSLRSLTLSCVEIHNGALDELPRCPTTSLVTLELVECCIDLDTLSTILFLPKALRSLKIGQNVAHTSVGFTTHLAASEYQIRDPSKLFVALEQQLLSLERLVYVERHEANEVKLPEHCDGFLNLRKLQEFSMIGDCTFMRQALMCKRTAPPNLTILSIEASFDVTTTESIEAAMGWVSNTVAAVPSLEAVSITTTREGLIPDSQEALDEIHAALQAIQQLGEMFEADYGTHLNLLRKTSNGFVPPILHDERPPLEEEIYTSTTHRFTNYEGMASESNFDISDANGQSQDEMDVPMVEENPSESAPLNDMSADDESMDVEDEEEVAPSL